MLLAHRNLLLVLLISLAAIFDLSPASAQIPGQVIIDEQFDGNSVDTSVFQYADMFEPGTFGRTLLRSPNLPGQAGFPFDPPPVQGGTLSLRAETYSPFQTPIMALRLESFFSVTKSERSRLSRLQRPPVTVSKLGQGLSTTRPIHSRRELLAARFYLGSTPISRPQTLFVTKSILNC